MKDILFVCHGNICRSPVAEFMFKKVVQYVGKEDDFYIESTAASNEGIGNNIYVVAKKIKEMRIPFQYVKFAELRMKITKILTRFTKNRNADLRFCWRSCNN